ncbi:hypothetical protein BHF70_02010 [Anaerostipes sp. 494a]|uniref:HAD hydrolase family protein n=1 Tax=Anaerostipes sp. 494a TaxID=1261636 RepID=UPI00095355E7|nr:HAD hydrolase family protein [Anaerostipes sp. 494a]OLR58501.1 hypothetical protein BHF70_02010 [Anaerostipes sp. 494a]
MRLNLKIPPVGQRIVRSVCAVILCFAVYFCMGKTGIPFYSALAVLQCIQPYHGSSMKMARKRTIGTFIGAFWGLIVIIIEVYGLQLWSFGSFFYYLMISFFTGVVLYTTVLLECKNASYFSCVVFLSITVMHIFDKNPFLFVLDRVWDTLLGVVIAILVNSFHLPREKRRDVLFVSGVDDTILTKNDELTPFSKVELNRMIEQGAMFTVSTIRTPASVRESLDGVNLKLPIIAMNGAVLYDIENNSYLMSYHMTYEQAKRIIDIMKEEHVAYFTNVVIDDSLIIYYEELNNEAVLKIYQQMKKSPFRNYIKHSLPKGENVVYFTIIDERGKIEKLHQRLLEQQWINEYRIVMYDSVDYPGYTYIKLYHRDATREHMLERLLEILDIHKVVTFGSLKEKYDVYVEDSDRNIMVKKLKRNFEPVKRVFNKPEVKY